MGRNAVLAAGWPEAVPATTLDRQCGSSQQALHFAAAGVVSGQYDIAVAGGVESMTRVAMGASVRSGPGLPFGPAMTARYGGAPFNQGVSAEMVARRWGLSREDVDRSACESHQRAAAARSSGAFADEIVPVVLDATAPSCSRATVPRQHDRDRGRGHPPGTTAAVLAGLKPAFEEGGTVTAGNASQISDGAGALLVTTSEVAAARGWHPMARVHAVAVVGVDPVLMLTGPMPATQAVLKRAGLDLADIGTFEVNEAFASVPLAWLAETGADPARLNPDGGAIALGHPLGGSGARLAVHAGAPDAAHAGRGTGCRRCARAAAWPTRRCSSASDEGADRRRGPGGATVLERP